MGQTYDQFRSSSFFTKTSSFAFDVLAFSGSGGRPCRRIRATGAGTITVKRASDGTSVVLDFLDGECQDVVCSEITSVSGPTAVTIYW